MRLCTHLVHREASLACNQKVTDHSPPALTTNLTTAHPQPRAAALFEYPSATPPPPACVRLNKYNRVGTDGTTLKPFPQIGATPCNKVAHTSPSFVWPRDAHQRLVRTNTTIASFSFKPLVTAPSARNAFVTPHRTLQ